MVFSSFGFKCDFFRLLLLLVFDRRHIVVDDTFSEVTTFLKLLKNGYGFFFVLLEFNLFRSATLDRIWGRLLLLLFLYFIGFLFKFFFKRSLFIEVDSLLFFLEVGIVFKSFFNINDSFFVHFYRRGCDHWWIYWLSLFSNYFLCTLRWTVLVTIITKILWDSFTQNRGCKFFFSN